MRFVLKQQTSFCHWARGGLFVGFPAIAGVVAAQPVLATGYNTQRASPVIPLETVSFLDSGVVEQAQKWIFRLICALSIDYLIGH